MGFLARIFGACEICVTWIWGHLQRHLVLKSRLLKAVKNMEDRHLLCDQSYRRVQMDAP